MNEGSVHASHNPRFFKILWPDVPSNLKLPRAFVKKHFSEEVVVEGAMATLLGPDGKTWNVSVHKDKEAQTTCFSGEEWRNCAQAYHLEPEYLLLFSYKGDMIFKFAVHDLTTCEKAYPAACAPVSATAAPSPSKVAKRIKTCKDGHRFEKIAMHRNAGPVTSCCKDCKCLRFEKIITQFSVKTNYMRIPQQFVLLASPSLRKGKMRLTLVDPKGRSWTVNIQQKRKTGGHYESYIGNGWLVFVRDNQLKKGDRCSFELEAGEKDVMRVQKLKS